MTPDQVQAEYDKVARDFGDLQFARESLVGQLKAVDEQMVTLRKRRDELQQAFRAASQKEPADAVAAATPSAE